MANNGTWASWILSSAAQNGFASLEGGRERESGDVLLKYYWVTNSLFF